MKTLEIIGHYPNNGRVDRTFIASFDWVIRTGLEFVHEGKTYRITYRDREEEMSGRVCYAEVRFRECTLNCVRI